MDEFTMSAFALFPDGRTDDAFAEVASPALDECFAQMAGEVADWLLLAHGRGVGEPRAIELTLEWSGAPAAEPAAEQPTVPGGPTRRRPSPPPRSLRCVARRRLGRTRAGFAVGAELPWASS